MTFPADWCGRTPSDISDRFDVIADISDGYYVAQTTGCETAGLTPFADGDLGSDWLDYLFGYTNAMVGCPLFDEPVVDGIRVFGPANTAAIGVPRPRLSPDDAEALIGLYSQEFTRGLSLSPEESTALVAYLRQVAVPDIDPQASRTLWICSDPPPPRDG